MEFSNFDHLPKGRPQSSDRRNYYPLSLLLRESLLWIWPRVRRLEWRQNVSRSDRLIHRDFAGAAILSQLH